MGKSSLLYQLADKLSAAVIPVRVDCQAGEMQDGNTALLYNLARSIRTDVMSRVQQTLPELPTLAEMNFTSFSLWLEEIETAIGDCTILLGLDEYEALGDAINKGWLDERILGFLRNLIQHHPKIDILLAGSHRPEERLSPAPGSPSPDRKTDPWFRPSLHKGSRRSHHRADPLPTHARPTALPGDRPSTQ